ncbi:MAG TPA: hypothetical protein VGQ36_21180, partial [Thermoanaerobaculia bacterium]|nr:hypothetical protein [Thermoanaerobaculia bacterium]
MVLVAQPAELITTHNGVAADVDCCAEAELEPSIPGAFGADGEESIDVLILVPIEEWTDVEPRS